MHVLHDQWERCLPQYDLRGSPTAQEAVGPKRFVVIAPIVVTGQAETRRAPTGSAAPATREHIGHHPGLAPSQLCCASPKISGE